MKNAVWTNQSSSQLSFPLMISSHLTRAQEVIELQPSIQMEGSVFTVENHSVDLRKQKILIAILEAFLQAPNLTISKDKLKSLICNGKDISLLSERMHLVLEHNLAKNLSRLRKELRTTLSPELYSAGDWFDFNSENNTYRLFTFNRKMLTIFVNQLLHLQNKS